MPTARRFTLRKAITAIRFAVTPIASWPLSVETKTTVFLMYNTFWFISIIHLMVAATAWIYTIQLNRNDLERIIKVSGELFGIASAVLKMIISKSQTSRLQILLAEMEMFLRDATSDELELLQLYVNKLVTFHGTIYVASFVGPMCFIVEPVISSQPLPLTATYPFSIEPTWIHVTLWISQIIILFQVGSMLVLNMMYAMLLWYTGARFEMLCIQFQNAKNENDIRRCIQKHQELLNYSSKLRASIRRMAVIVFGLAIMAATNGGFILTQSLKVGYSAYASSWVGKTPKMQKNIRIVIQRSNIPLTISITGILPTLSLELAATCVTACFSYITTLHAFVG
ncbi:uncharacterized protein LOC105685031 isoform X2 [Athalia rosae]|uniref:uncharacterized protein LOC105685031 isoform X2 n=1 Tax=Athalia rosae TaxID=37344 RepID=UPI0020348194|nr:uncharacterized protein LOC105685031 isoform X2 [Athalia rosae]